MLEQSRIDYAITKLCDLGYDAKQINDTAVQFIFSGKPVTLYPYTGWYTGKTVKDGRGINNLIKQINYGTKSRRQSKD